MESRRQPQDDQFLRLYAEHEPSLHGYVRSLVPTRDDAREVMQEVAVALWRKFEGLATAAEFRPWAFGVARMEVMAWRRDRGRDRHFFGEEAMTIIARESEQMGRQLEAQQEALEECLGKLPAEQRSLVCAAYAPGVRIDRLAEEQGRTAMALYKILHRIRLALVDCTRAVLAREGRT
jgi:RNA polymerase sigma-70 factor (ECF subfamily)